MLGEQVSMNQALVVTVFSMSIVFLALLIISFILDIFRIISVGKTQKIKEEALPEVSTEETSQEQEDEEELVAIITAAIANSIGKSMDRFTVKNIARTPDSESAWTKAGRIELMR